MASSPSPADPAPSGSPSFRGRRNEQRRSAPVAQKRFEPEEETAASSCGGAIEREVLPAPKREPKGRRVPPGSFGAGPSGETSPGAPALLGRGALAPFLRPSGRRRAGGPPGPRIPAWLPASSRPPRRSRCAPPGEETAELAGRLAQISTLAGELQARLVFPWLLSLVGCAGPPRGWGRERRRHRPSAFGDRARPAEEGGRSRASLNWMLLAGRDLPWLPAEISTSQIRFFAAAAYDLLEGGIAGALPRLGKLAMNGSEKPSLANEILEQLPLAEKTAVWGTLGTIRPHLSFDAGKDAQIFFEAISGEGIKYGVVIDLLTNRSNAHRQQIAEAFLNFTQQDLLKMLGAMVSGQLETVITGLLRPATQYDAHEIKAGLQGLETETLIEIASSRTAQQLQEISDYYKRDFKSDLEMDIVSGTTGGFKDLLIALIKGKRESYSGIIDYVLIQQDSEALAAAGGDAGRLESEWIRILTQRSPEHLKRVFSWYHKMTGAPVEETMEKHFQGHFREAGLTLASLLRNAPLYFATKLYQAIKDAGRSPRTAARIMISRSETDLLSIRTEFKRRYGISLYSFIGEETKGDYQAALLGLCKAEDL